MTLTFFTNYIHHHQIPLADEFFKHLGHDYRYVAMEKLPESFVKGGYDPTIERPYIIKAYESDLDMRKAKDLMLESDIVIGLNGPKGYSTIRQKQNKITFNYSERWRKRSLLHSLDPRVIFRIYKSYFKFRNNRSYMLCASAFAANDANFYFCYPNKCYKWGYFPKVVRKTKKTNSPTDGSIKIMWCSRFIDLKHPELPVLMAEKLKEKGIKFELNMFGGGDLFPKIRNLVNNLRLNDVVFLKGNLPNDDILKEMGGHDIFLFTSDKGEGWGAVLGEAMSQGCAVVASDLIGAAPYLIQDNINGLLFKSEDLESLYEKVLILLDKELRIKIANNAIKTMQSVWSPEIAAERFIRLSERLMLGLDTDFTEGPCSKA